MKVLLASRRVDRPMLVLALTLTTVGLVMIFSSSIDISMERSGTSTYYLSRHLLKVFVGLSAMVVAMQVDFRQWKRWAKPIFLGSLALLLLTKLIYLAEGNHRPARWLNLGVLNVQTSDVARFALITYLAAFLDRKRDRVSDLASGFLPPILWIGITMALVLIQPNFSTACVIGLLGGVMLFVGGAKWQHLASTAGAGVLVLIPVLFAAGYRTARIRGFLNSGDNLLSANYQLAQSLVSLGNGGLTGVGLGESSGKKLFLPAPHTDFILSIIGEEFGFIGTIAVLVLFLALFHRALKIAKQCPDLFGVMLSLGIALQFLVYTFINAAVVCGIVPTTGLPMPFISFGGSSLVMNLFCVGVLLNVSMGRRSVFPSGRSADAHA